MAAIIEKITNACCGGLDKEDEKPMQIYGNPNKKKVNKVSEDEGDVAETEEESRGAKKAKAKAATGKFTGKDTKYEDVMWEDLPKEASEAATVLGYDKESWDNNGWPPVQDKAFGDLTEEETTAAITLGWDAVAWDTKYEDLNFADLPEQVKAAAESIGFTQEMWDGDEWPAVGEKWWADMTIEEQCGLNVMGYTKVDWEG